MNIDVRNRFLQFLHDREAMRVHKNLIGGAGPHSPDPILAAHRFCNINREHDYVTRVIHINFRVPFKDKSKTFMVRQMLFCRIFNEPDVILKVCPFETVKAATKILKAYRDAGHKLLRGAYMMPPHGKNTKGIDTLVYWMSVIAEATEKSNEPDKWSLTDYDQVTELATVAKMLMNVCGVGPFLANQVCTDLRYVPLWGRSYTDWETFVLCGPGTRRGLNRFYGRKLEHPGSDSDYADELLLTRFNLHLDLNQTFRDYFIDPNNLANSFCEFDKYERAQQQLKEGKELTLRHWSPAPANTQLELF